MEAAAWAQHEVDWASRIPGVTADRAERLEEALRICRQMWSEDDAPFEGKHYHLGRTLNLRSR